MGDEDFLSLDEALGRDGEGQPTTVEKTIERASGKEVPVLLEIPKRGVVRELNNMDGEEIEENGIEKVLVHFKKPEFRQKDENGEYIVPEDIIDEIPNPEIEEYFKVFFKVGSGNDELVDQTLEKAKQNPEMIEGN